MERETGIEPATNSLEGCDSTTELLPPTLTLALLAAPAGQPLLSHLAAGQLASSLALPRLTRAGQLTSQRARSTGLPAGAASAASAWPRLVARGGFEPPKPLGRQIYSLLRLT